MSDTLPIERAKVLFKKLRAWAVSDGIGRLAFIWHGGEPTLLPMEYFQKILREERRLLSGVHYSNSLQSNLSVPLSDEYVHFLVGEGFMTGMSFDVINTARDPDNSHKATVLKNLHRFARYGSVPGAITVVSRYNVDYPHLLYDFFCANKVNAHFNRAGSFLKTKRPLYITTEEYFEFMRDMFLMWRDDGFKGFKIGNIVDMAKRIVRPDRNSMCFFDESCIYGRIHIAMNGDVYPCDNLVDRRELIYGNIYDRAFSLKGIFSSSNPVFRIFERRRVEMRRKCEGCEFFPYCYGGCPNDAIRSGSSFYEKTDMCSYYKKMFSLIGPYAKRIVKAWS